MEMTNISKRCIIIEGNTELEETNIREYFGNVINLKKVQNPSSCHDVQIFWVLLFKTEDEADAYIKKKRVETRDKNFLMIHSCTKPCDIPLEWIQEDEQKSGPADDTNVAANQPPGYSEIDPMPVPVHGNPHQSPFYPDPHGQYPAFFNPYPGQNMDPNKPPPYNHDPHSSQQTFDRQLSQQELKRPQSEQDLNKAIPEKKLMRLEDQHGVGFNHPPFPPGTYGTGMYGPQQAGYYGPQQHDGATGNPHDKQGLHPLVYPGPGYPGYHYPGYGYPNYPGQPQQYPQKGDPYPYPHTPFQAYHAYHPYYQYMGQQPPDMGQQPPPTVAQAPVSQMPGHSTDTEQSNLMSVANTVTPEQTVHTDNSFTDNEENTAETDEEDFQECNTEPKKLSFDNLEMTGSKLEQEKQEIEENKPKSPRMIKVSKIPPGTSEDAIRFFFENKRKSGGGDIEEIDYEKESHTAIITFQEDDVAERVINKQPLLFEKKIIEVEIYMIQTEDLLEDGEPSGNQEDTDKPTEFAIEVRGMKSTTSKDTIMYYFEGRKGADTDVVKMIYKEEENTYILWFDQEDAIETVLKRSHRVDGQILDIKKYVPPPPPKPVPKYDNKVFITNISSTTTKDGLDNFLEAKSKVETEEIIFGEAEGTALVTFQEPPDIDKLQSVCSKRPLDGSYLKLHTVAITDCVVVTGFQDTTSSDTLEFYFDNKKRSGVEGVRDIKLIKEEGKCLVYFTEPNSALEVCKREHRVEGSKLQVQVYYECLGQAAMDEDGPKFKALKPTLIQNLNPWKIEFLKNNKMNQTAFEKQLSGHHAVVQWPDVKDLIDKLEIICTLSDEVPDCRKLAKTWAKTVTSEAGKFFEMLTVIECETLQEVWDDILKQLHLINIPYPDSVFIKVVKKDFKVFIVGHTIPAEEVAKKVQTIIQNITDDLDRKKQEVTEEVTLKLHQLLVLLYIHFMDKMKQEFVGLNIFPNMKKLTLTFTGMSGHVTAVKVKMFEQLQKVVGTPMGKFSDDFLKYLKVPEVRSFLGQQFKEEGILGVWDVQDDNVITMYSLSDEGIITAIKVFKESVKEVPIDLDSKQTALLETQTWKDEVKAIESEFNKAHVQIKVVASTSIKVIIYMTSAEDEGILKEKVSDIFYKHAISEEQLKFSSAEMRLLQEQYKTEIDGLVDDFKKDHVTVMVNNIGVFLKGNDSGVQLAKQKLEIIVKSIFQKKYTLTKAGIVKHMHSEQGHAKLTQIERKNKVVVELQDDIDDEDTDLNRPSTSRHSSTGWTETAECKTPTGQTITTVVGDITALTVDVIVNAANKELKHVGGLAKVIVDKGGIDIQKECDSYVSTKNREKKMYEGEVFCSRPGKLNCKMIAHAVGPVWQNGRSGEEDYLCECIQASLERTDDKKYKSIAIPALCAGVFGYPVQKATKVIVEAIRDFLKDNKSTTIQQIYLCDVKDDTVEFFVDALEKHFGKTNIQKMRGRSSHLSSAPPSQRKRESDDGGFVHVPYPKKDAPTSHISVTIVKGQMATQEVDVIVNTTSTTLQLNQGAVSASLLKLGGQILQTECTQKYPSGIQLGEVAVTSGGKLECKLVCHGALPGWNGGTATKVMETFMKNCLQTASDNGFMSVAFPALGTGNLGYPKDVVARTMFSCVERFSSSHSGSTVCDVRFVVYEKDFQTIKAFEEEQRKRQSGEYTTRTARKLDSDDSDQQGGQGATGGWEKEALGGDKQASVDIGDITLKIYQGDITEAEVDVIVNGTNRELDLTRGGVAMAIKNKGGEELMKNLRLPSTKSEMQREGITVTHSGVKFNCEYIIHIDMEDSKGELKDKFKDVLQKVDMLDKKSVALPALGAGVSYSMEKVAGSIFEALISFEKKKTDVKEVHVVIFQADMLSKFLSAIENYMQKSDAQSQGLFSKLKGLLGYGDKNPVKAKHWMVTKKQKSSLNLTVYAKNQSSADAALRTLEENMISDYREKLVEDPVVKELSNDQEAKILKIQDKCEVEIEVNKRIGRIKIYGLIENLSEALDEIHKIIRDVDRKKQKYQHAKLVADIVQWYFISVEDTGQKLEEYPAEVNLILEQALSNNDPQAFFLDNSGNKYIVDFNTYEEYPEDDPTDTVAVLRKSKQTDSAFDMPANWAPMDQNENIKIVTLQATDKEYSDVTKDFQTQMGGNYSSIIKVEKIQNRTLQQQYVAKKKLMDSTNPPGHNNEMKLWHGTAIDAIDSINTYGFNRSYCGKNAVAYGNGVYFAVNPTYSAQSQYARPDPAGNKRMYLCKVLVGEFTKGQGGMKVPPQKPGAAGSHILYDSVVDNPAMPGIYVIFHDTQAYPEYLIVFK